MGIDLNPNFIGFSVKDPISNKIIHTERIFSHAELQQASQYVNENFIGKEFSQLKQFLKKKPE